MNDVYMIDGLDTGIMRADELDISVVFFDKQANINFEVKENIETLLE